MKSVIQIKLNTSKEQHELLLQTILHFNAACQEISSYCFDNQMFSKFKVQNVIYNSLKENYKLSAQVVIRAIAKVCDAYIAHKAKEYNTDTLIVFKAKSSAVYDSRILSYKNNFSSVSIWTLQGRILVPITIWNKEIIPYIKGEADLIIRKNQFFLIQTLDVPTPAIRFSNELLGVDLGIINIATDSDGQIFSGDIVKRKRLKYFVHRQSLQKKKTHSSKRRLRKIGKRESNFRKDINHKISKVLVQKANDTCRGLALEGLINFFDKKKVRKSERNERASWSFRQLRDFIQYKALLAGVQVILVDPAYTSQECSNCGYVNASNRKTQSEFLCQLCGFAANADSNAAVNISRKAAVNQPTVSAIAECNCQIQAHDFSRG